MGPYDQSDPMDADNRTSAEHYIFGRYIGAGGQGVVVQMAYIVSGSLWGYGYQGLKQAGLYSTASPPSYMQLYWEEKAYTDAVGLSKVFTGGPGKGKASGSCGCGGSQ